MTFLSAALIAGCTSGESGDPVPSGGGSEAVAASSGDRADAPFVGGVQLATLESSSLPPAPTQWGEGDEAIPFGQWWSGLAVGPGIPALWALPLLLRMDETGRADLSAPTLMFRDDGFRDTSIDPAIFFEFGTNATVKVVGHGAFHVTFTVTTATADVTITMMQGSPFLEFEGTGTLELTIPALEGLESGAEAGSVSRFETAAGPWLLASSAVSQRTVDGDLVVLNLEPGTGYVIGPVADDAGEALDASALESARSTITSTTEDLAVDSDGTVHQTLRQTRTLIATADAVSDDVAEPLSGELAWSLLPHHSEFLAADAEPIGTLSSVYGESAVVAASELVLDYPAIPILWDAVTPPGFDASGVASDDLPEIGIGSYFGAKHTAATATQADILRSAGALDKAGSYLDAAFASLDALMTPTSEPNLTWEPGWGSVVVTPAEFGAANELNDHQLQNGYWVGAAASVVAADPNKQSLLEDGIDLIVADYAGSAVVPHLADTVSGDSTWSPFVGHSWAAGLGTFAAGNNLESISESSYAWWAAAKWFLVSGRAELAEPFVARLTIESWLTADEWLPTEANQSTTSPVANVRPWSGVVWAGKADPGTWFDPSDEAALGIRLLPLGPQSFSRYLDQSAVDAANARWDWCDESGDGCVERWWNLLDSDAAVAGRPPLATGDLPEEGTTELVRLWWRSHWESSTLADGWSCTPGAVVRVAADGSLVALVSNPSPAVADMACTKDGQPTFEQAVEPYTSAAIPFG